MAKVFLTKAKELNYREKIVYFSNGKFLKTLTFIILH